jgi:sec-independent protein translocase protein TatA
MMGDMAKGIKAFKKGMSDDDTASAGPKRDPKSIDHQPSSTVRTETEKKVG